MKKPNILLFITDQQRADHVGCYGNKIVKTPNIDAIAAKGTRFDKFYVNNPICSPNRASLMTGRMPSSHGLRYNGAPLALTARTFVESLAESGYQTALIGKSHLQNMNGGAPEWLPSEDDFAVDKNGFPREATRHNFNTPDYKNENSQAWEDDPDHKINLPFYGFDHAEICTRHADRTGGSYLRWIEEKYPDYKSLRGRENALPDNRISTPQAWRTAVPEELYSTAYVGTRTIDYIENHAALKKESPFFIQCSFPDPHHPFTPPGKYWDMYDPASIPIPEWFNEGMSPITQHLRSELKNGTAIRESQMPYAVTRKEAQEAIALTYGMISMVDDYIGEVLATLDRLKLTDDTLIIFTSDHGDYMGDHGLMLKGPIHLHGMLRVPFIWSDPHLATPDIIQSLASTIDIAPTVLDRAGIKPYYGIQGLSLTGALDGSGNYRREATLIEDDRERVYLGLKDPQRVRTMITEQYRLTKYQPLEINELYDLVNDPAESTNLWNEPKSEAIRAQLTNQMLELIIKHQDKTPLSNGDA
jgi:arylsulfatase A-like enzyme